MFLDSWQLERPATPSSKIRNSKFQYENSAYYYILQNNTTYETCKEIWQKRHNSRIVTDYKKKEEKSPNTMKDKLKFLK